ncbi:hypothetical protein PG994_004130 [Apiospora phragmitis]|uniref:Uncharacterized protein n=1 Tax=Apiospora phragmitis TaxID=2905665 RepID=A0ABR1VPQ8_9PEZI
MLFQSTPWMLIHVLWILIILPLVQGSPITSQFLVQPATTTSSSPLSSSFPIASPSYRPAITATPTAASDAHSSFSSFTSSGISSAVTAAPLVPPSLQSGGSAGLLLPHANATRNHNNINLKFVQTTYWSCVQWPTTMHCGWHEPILDASNGAGSPGRGREGPRRAVGAGLVAGLVGFFVAAA